MRDLTKDTPLIDREKEKEKEKREEKKRPAHDGIQAHNLFVMRRVLYCCATRLPKQLQKLEIKITTLEISKPMTKL